MSITFHWGLFAAMTMVSSVICAQPVTITTPEMALRVSVLSAPSTKGTLSFRVQNTSPQPILYFTLAISNTYSDGVTDTISFPMDFTTTLPLVGRIVAAPADAQIGPIQPQKTVPYNIQVSYRNDHGSVVRTAILPTVVVFDNNTVVGDAGRATSDFFSRHAALVVEYDEYLRALDAARQSTQASANLSQLQTKYSQAADGLNVLGRDQTLYGHLLRSDYSRLAWELQSVIQRLDRGSEPSAAILASHISDIQARRAAYLAHSKPATTGGQR